MILAVLQARFSSTRLPGKVLKPILGKPMLMLQLERIRRVTDIDGLIVATSMEAQDDALAAMCGAEGVACHRGSLNDVLDRFYQAARSHAPDHVIRLTGDCPLADPEVISGVIRAHLAARADYTSNVLPPTFPDGLDVEIMNFACLEEAWREATLPSQREHVTPFINRQPARYKLHNFANAADLSGLRWTVDEPADFEFVKRVYEALYPSHPDFSTADILALMEKRPELAALNNQHTRNEGYAKSLLKDKETL